MKKLKNYIDTELAKKKIARYKYWSVKDENGITISSSDEENQDNRSFSDLLDKIIADNVDAEIQVKYGANEQSSRNNPPFFIKINEDIEWIEPEEETVTINGQPHRVDKNGHVNINLSAPERMNPNEPKVEYAKIDYVRQEMDMQLAGLRREYELKEEKWNAEMHNKLAEQMLQFKEMMLADRESRLAEREQQIAQREAELFEKENEIQGDLKGYLKQVPSALGGVLKELISDKKESKALGEGKKEQPKRTRRTVKFSVVPDESETPEDEITPEEIEAEIRKYEEMELEDETEQDDAQPEETEEQQYEREFEELLNQENNEHL